MKKATLAIALLVLASLACIAVAGGGSNVFPTISSNPTPITQNSNPTPEPLDTTSIFEDDFSDSNSGWPIEADSDKAASYDGSGQYLITATKPRQDVWAPYPGDDLSDVRVEVDASKSFGPEDNSFGIVCRFVDNDNFYFLVVSSDGYQAIGKYQAGQFSYLSAEQMEQTSGINPGTAVNHIRADCVGSTLTLYVNGQQVSSVTDGSFPIGEVGLIVGTFDEPNVGVLFDNFVVTRP